MQECLTQIKTSLIWTYKYFTLTNVYFNLNAFGPEEHVLWWRHQSNVWNTLIKRTSEKIHDYVNLNDFLLSLKKLGY